jgi:hypothetical protein
MNILALFVFTHREVYACGYDMRYLSLRKWGKGDSVAKSGGGKQPSQAKTPRDRATFYPTRRAREILDQVPTSKRSQYINDRIVVPRNDSDVSPDAFLEKAEKEIILVGPSLRLTASSSTQDLLRQKVFADNVSLQVVMLPRGLKPEDALYQVLENQWEYSQLFDHLLRDIETSADFFTRLQQEAVPKGHTVEVRFCQEMPMCGLIIRDPDTPQGCMRATVYSNFTIGVRHAFWELSLADQADLPAFQTYNRYYSDLRTRSRRS